MRVAMILPWYGPKPWYWPLFEASAKRIGMDVIVVAEKGFRVKERNFRVVEMSLDEVRRWAERALGTGVNLTRGYKLCDLRPMYGVVFADVLEDYDYWAYGDCDVIYGRKFNDFLAKVVDGDWDVATVRSKWLSGPFTLFKNVPKINTLFERAKNWREMLSSPDNQWFDEFGKDWFMLQCSGDVSMEDLYKRSFGGVVWNASDIRFLHEDVICEDRLKRGIVRMHAEGTLMLDKCEISLFHHIAAKASPAFVGRILPREYADEYVLTRCGYLPAGNGFLRAAVAAGHFVRGWCAFAWKLVSGDVSARAQVRRWLRRRLGRADWWV